MNRTTLWRLVSRIAAQTDQPNLPQMIAHQGKPWAHWYDRLAWMLPPNDMPTVRRILEEEGASPTGSLLCEIAKNPHYELGSGQAWSARVALARERGSR